MSTASLTCQEAGFPQGVLVLSETLHTMSGQEQADSWIKQEVPEEEDTDTSEKEQKNEDEKYEAGSEVEEDPAPKEKSVWVPSVLCTTSKERYCFVGHTIDIYESLDSFGAVIWPAALALCQFLDNNRKQIDLLDKTVLEIGAGTGLVSIVACLLGASVTATDLPDILGNLCCNLNRNTRGHCKHAPQVAALCWEQDLEQSYPRSIYRYDYVLAADVVYHHDFLDELLVTMKHFCLPGTTLIWANKVRFQTDLRFTDNFKQAFHTTLLADLPEQEVKIFMARSREE
ncbi:protein-lysine methyltransferase METTL21C isoform X1 [Brienomyrus brachyistius]|uniref:protein-lysine methyltransferase METTL21C isoform X1 n=2 Tax=Brienomyrus brachyistius TaxID=42636 RepID=UPI0020B4013D|nr:protein-lysine methyltransferase METTL21C isoform X1 [Brienomyrus brachyistius]